MSGLFILSLDTEIAWGTYGEAAIARQRHAFDHYRSLVRRLLDMLDQYAIPATWAVVGHLFLKQGDEHAITLRRPDYPEWYHAPDVIEMIRSASTPHEIGTHTFTHAFADEVTPDDWDNELRICAKLHQDHNLTLRSLVYPRNHIAYTEMLPQYGIIAYRGAEQKWYRQPSGVVGRVLSYLDYLLALPPVTYDPATLRVGEKLVNLPASQFLMSYDRLRGWIPTASRVRQAKLGIERAVTRNHLYHLWFHPFNLGSSHKMFDALEQILREVARRRDSGQLRVMTMQQAAQWIIDGIPDTQNSVLAEGMTGTT
jgi:peptidoglycan/xylan/chitin deacetylase (PgdA/CDA1 family)